MRRLGMYEGYYHLRVRGTGGKVFTFDGKAFMYRRIDSGWTFNLGDGGSITFTDDNVVYVAHTREAEDTHSA